MRFSPFFVIEYGKRKRFVLLMRFFIGLSVWYLLLTEPLFLSLTLLLFQGRAIVLVFREERRSCAKNKKREYPIYQDKEYSLVQNPSIGPFAKKRKEKKEGRLFLSVRAPCSLHSLIASVKKEIQTYKFQWDRDLKPQVTMRKSHFHFFWEATPLFQFQTI